MDKKAGGGFRNGSGGVRRGVKSHVIDEGLREVESAENGPELDGDRRAPSALNGERQCVRTELTYCEIASVELAGGKDCVPGK